MKTLSKKTLAAYVGALLGGVAIAPTANAVHFATDGLGDALTNYYTTWNGNATLINYTNTSDQTIAMRVRLHEYRNSRSWDFTVILSPWDVWNATIADGGALGPVIYTADQSCTIPRISQDSSNPTIPAQEGFLEAINDGGPVSVDRLREGYVAAIAMGSKDGDPDTCAIETARFINYGPQAYTSLLANYPYYTNNAIKGVYNILNLPLGQNAAGGMDTLADFYDGSRPPAPNAGGSAPDYVNQPTNLITLQMHPDDISLQSGLTIEQRYLASFFLPTLASANTNAYIVLADNLIGTTAAPVNRVGAQAVSYLYSRTNVINQWTALDGVADWDTATDLVVQSFVKQFFVDGDGSIYSGRYQFKPGVPPQNVLGNGVYTAPFSQPYTNGLSCDPVTWDVYDREENWDTKPIFFSPSKWGPNLCHEVNVVTFNGISALRSPNAYNIPTSFVNGWIDLSLISEANRFGRGQNSPITPWNASFYGLPVASIGFTTRVNQQGLNEAVQFPSAFKRNWAKETTGYVTTGYVETDEN